MGSPWSRWTIFEYMKHRYLRTGQVPSESELLEELPDIDQTELAEGMAEFGLILGNWPITGRDRSCDVR